MSTHVKSSYINYLADEDDDGEVCLYMLVKRFEDSNLIINRDHLRMDKIIGQGNLFPFTLSHWKTTMPNEPRHDISNNLTF